MIGYVLLCTIILIILTAQIYYISTRKGQERTIYLLFSLLSAFVMIIAFIFEVTATDLNEARRALYMQYIGYTPFIFFFTFETFKACGYKIKKQYLILSTAYTALIFFLVFTNQKYGLYFDEIYLKQAVNGREVLAYTHTTLGMVLSSVIYLLIFVSVANIIAHYSTWSSVLKKQLNYFLFGIIISSIIQIMELANVADWTYHLTYFELSFVVIIYTFGIYKKSTFDIEPLAIDMAMQSMKNAIIVLDKDWTFVYANNAAKEKSNSLNNLLQGSSIDDVENLPDSVKMPHDEGVYEDSYIECNEKVHTRITVKNLVNKNKIIGYMLSFVDITEMKNSLIEAEKIAYTDPLVKVFNRRGFYKKLDELNKGELEKTSMLLVDIDHFKRVNDTYGHDVGDIVLVKLCEILSENVEKTSVVARYGGEEFIVAITNNSLDYSLKKAEEIRKIVERYNFEIAGKVTVSIGVSMYEIGSEIDEVIKRADEALYKAKEASRNAVFYYDIDNKIKPYSNVEISDTTKGSFNELYKFMQAIPFKTIVWDLNRKFICASHEFINMLKTDFETYSKNPKMFNAKEQDGGLISEDIIFKYIRNLKEGQIVEKNWKYVDAEKNIVPTKVSIAKVNYLGQLIIVAYVEDLR